MYTVPAKSYGNSKKTDTDIFLCFEQLYFRLQVGKLFLDTATIPDYPVNNKFIVIVQQIEGIGDC